jgi:diguanylate cyclase (GGDEF)-like protein
MADAQSSILIVDDDAEDLASVERTLRSLGSELFTVKDPHEVIPSVHRFRPDVVVLDALLPGLSGFDLCKQIKSDAQLKATQVLILTGVYLRQQYRQEALQQFKADAFLTKPFRPPELQRLVVQLLSKKTRTPQSSFLKRIGLPPSDRKKKGLLGRFFGKSEEEDTATLRIAPVARDALPSPAAEPSAPSSPAAEGVRAPLPPKSAPEEPAAPAAEPAATEAEAPKIEEAQLEEPKPMEAAPEESRSEEAGTEDVKTEVEAAAAEVTPEPEPEPVAASTREPEAPAEPRNIALPFDSPEPTGPREEWETAPESQDINPLPPPAEPAVEAAPTETTDEEPSPATVLDGPPEKDAETVTWIEAGSKTREMTVDEAAARLADAPPSAAAAPEESPAVPAEPEPEVIPESVPPLADALRATRRPLFRVGEVPIYDEPEFLRELKRELSKCKRVDRPLTLILIRIGDLGQIIELFGKDFRERVLWHIAEQAMESLREVDLVGMMSSKDLIALTAFASDRYGGGRIVSRLRQAATKKPFRVGEELPPIIPILGFGMASFPSDGADVSSLLRRAEEDLAKGQDRAVVSD